MSATKELLINEQLSLKKKRKKKKATRKGIRFRLDYLLTVSAGIRYSIYFYGIKKVLNFWKEIKCRRWK